MRTTLNGASSGAPSAVISLRDRSDLDPRRGRELDGVADPVPMVVRTSGGF